MLDLEILYEDNHVMAIIKPHGMPVQKDASGDKSLIDFVKDHIKKRDNKPGNVFISAVHRIDRPAGGIVLLAKTSKAASRLAEAFRNNRIHKKYLAVVEGCPRTKEQRLEGWIVKDRAKNTSKIVPNQVKGAKFASLTYRVIGQFKKYSILEIDLETGRSHQIRVQLSGAGFPIAGDLRYGAKEGFGKMIALFAVSLTFPHPTKNEEIKVCAQIPADWEKVFGRESVKLIKSFMK